jgi:hypothetical protein
MIMVQNMSRIQNDPDIPWWERTWRERESLLVKTFGEMIPPNTVRAFYWDDIAVRIPGGCAMTFSMNYNARVAFLTLGHGLTQPISSREMHSVDNRSGYGWEFGVVTDDNNEWRFDILYQLMTYVRQSGHRIESGHRVPFSFFRTSNGQLSAALGKPSALDDARRLSDIASMVFWPLATLSRDLVTSTGRFGILIGTTISAVELDLAKQTSSAHLILLLYRSGIGQLSNPSRGPVINSAEGRRNWAEIKSLPVTEVECQLRSYMKG